MPAAPDPRRLAPLLRTAAVAGTLSGLPSTAPALATGRSPLAATRAAGTLLGRPGLGRGLIAHAVLSLGWTAVIDRALTRRRGPLATVAAGAGLGALVALLDLGLVGRRFPAVRALPAGPQVADHLAFGACVGAARWVRDGRRA